MPTPTSPFRQFLRLGPSGWLQCGRAVVELALANRKLGSRTAREQLSGPPRCDEAGPGSALSDEQARLVERVAYLIPRIAARVPWRSDCLVQALAAQRWLAGSKIASDIWIGVRKPDPGQFDAHAWLKAGGRVVTGGDVSGFTPLIGEARAAAAPSVGESLRQA